MDGSACISAWTDLTQRLGREPEERVWALLDESGWVEEYDGGNVDIETLVAVYSKIQRKRSRSITRDIPADHRLQARNVVLGDQARQLPAVTKFRSRWLPGKLIDPGVIDAWLVTELEDPPSLTSTASLVGSLIESGMVTPRDPRFQSPIPSVQNLSCASQLHILACSLSTWTFWSAGASLKFVLTGTVPETSLARGTGELHDGPFGVLKRISLVIDPSTAPTAVTDLYRQIRDELGTPRHRQAKRNPAVLIAFIDKQRGAKWATILAAWNKAYPDWSYSQVTNLQRDYARARKQTQVRTNDA